MKKPPVRTMSVDDALDEIDELDTATIKLRKLRDQILAELERVADRTQVLELAVEQIARPYISA